MKKCTKCSTIKDLSCFGKDRGPKASKSGLKAQCKECIAKQRMQLYWKFPEAQRALSLRWKRNNKERHDSYLAEYRANNREKRNLQTKIWKGNNKDKVGAYAMQWHAAKKQAIPAWADKNKIQSFYTEAQKLSQRTGIKYHVDHIVPLTSTKVCGLHVEQNLRVIPAFDNLSKKNYWWPHAP